MKSSYSHYFVTHFKAHLLQKTRFKFQNFIKVIIIFSCSYKASSKESEFIDTFSQDIYDQNSTTVTQYKDFKLEKNKFTTCNVKDLFNIHRFSFEHKKKSLYQTLGVNGSPCKHIYRSLIDRDLGYHSGYNAYNSYFFNIPELIIYDSKSPFAEVVVTLARYGSFYSDICFSRNIINRWNIGATFSLAVSQKEFSPNVLLDTNNSDRQIIGNNFRIFTKYESLHNTYTCFANFSFFKYRAREFGGIYIFRLPRESLIDTNPIKYLDLVNSTKNAVSVTNKFNTLNYLNVPMSVDIRKVFILYQQVTITKNFKLYNENTLELKTNYFEIRNRERDDHDFKNHETGSNYKFPSIKDSDTNDNLIKNLFQLGLENGLAHRNLTHYNDIGSFSNEFGCKIFIQKLLLMPYYRIKYLTSEKSSGIFFNPIVPREYLKNTVFENYLGIHTNLDLESLILGSLELSFEFLFKNKFSANLAYINDFIKIQYNTSKKSPSELEKNFYWYGREWNNDFEDIYINELSSQIYYKTKYIEIIPLMSIYWITNPIFFIQKQSTLDDDLQHKTLLKQYYDLYNNVTTEQIKQASENTIKINPRPISLPKQTINTASVLIIGSDANLKLGNFRLNTFFSIFNNLNRDVDVIKAPLLTMDIMFFYTIQTKNGKGNLAFGVDNHFKTSYKADSYDPTIQQFYIQDNFDVFFYPVVDIFFNFRVDRFKMFIKWSHINEFITESKGYFSTPFYPGQKMALDIGIVWNFFD